MTIKSAKFVAELLGVFMRDNKLVPQDIMRAMVVIFNPKVETAPACEIKPEKKKKEKVVNDDQLCTS